MASKYGIDTLIESFALLVNKFSSAQPSLVEKLQLRLVGSGPQMDEYKQLAVRLGIAQKVSFVGRVPHQAVFVKQVVRFLMQLIRHFSLTRYSPSMGLARPL